MRSERHWSGVEPPYKIGAVGRLSPTTRTWLSISVYCVSSSEESRFLLSTSADGFKESPLATQIIACKSLWSIVLIMHRPLPALGKLSLGPRTISSAWKHWSGPGRSHTVCHAQLPSPLMNQWLTKTGNNNNTARSIDCHTQVDNETTSSGMSDSSSC